MELRKKCNVRRRNKLTLASKFLGSFYTSDPLHRLESPKERGTRNKSRRELRTKKSPVDYASALRPLFRKRLYIDVMSKVTPEKISIWAIP